MDKENIIRQYLEQLDDKDFDISKVRRELEKKQVEEADIKEIMRAVDRQLLKKVVHSSNEPLMNDLFGIGVILTIFGIVFTITPFIFNQNFRIFAFGPLASGIALMFGRYRISKKRNERFLRR